MINPLQRTDTFTSLYKMVYLTLVLYFLFNNVNMKSSNQHFKKEAAASLVAVATQTNKYCT